MLYAGAACVKLQVDCLGVCVKIELDHGPINASSCPLWGKSRHVRRKKECPLYAPRKRTPANGHVCLTPESRHVRCNN